MGSTCTPEFRWDFRALQSHGHVPPEGENVKPRILPIVVVPRGWKLILPEFFIVDTDRLSFR